MRSTLPMTVALSLALVAVCALPSSAWAARKFKLSPRADTHEHAAQALRKGDFAQAAQLFTSELQMLAPDERGTAIERDAREQLAFAQLSAGNDNAAVESYRALVLAFPGYRLDPDKYLPETISFFDDATKPKVAASTPAVAEPPRVIQATAAAPEPKRWHWYYLAPLGIGQFAARSPVRGTIFAALEVGFAATNVVGAVMYQRDVHGSLALNPAQGKRDQLLMDIGFFGLIGSLVAAVIDGALERSP